MLRPWVGAGWIASGLLLLSVLTSCSAGSGARPPAASPSASTGAVSLPHDKAAGLRLQLNLLLGAHVLWLARTGDALIGMRHDEATAFGSAAHQSAGAISSELADLSGDTQSAQKAGQALQSFDTAFLDYTAAAFKQDNAAMQAAYQPLSNTYVQPLADLLAPLTGLPAGQLAPLLSKQADQARAMVDAMVKGASWQDIYQSLRSAYAQARNLADTLAPAIARRQGGRFPGNAASSAAGTLAAAGALLQEQTHLAGLAAAAAVGARADELTAAQGALEASRGDLSQALSAAGGEAQKRIVQVFADPENAVIDEAGALSSKNDSGQQQARVRLTGSFTNGIGDLAPPLGMDKNQAQSLARGLGQAWDEMASDEGGKSYQVAPAAVREAADQGTALDRGMVDALVQSHQSQFK
jgi:hypothetical protein